jgi:hypothetical protein
MMNSVKVSKNAQVTSTTYSTYSNTYPSQLQSISTYPPPSLQSISTYPPPPQSISTYPPPPPPTYLPSSSQLTSTYSLSSYPNNDSHPTVKLVPELEDFLKELDAIYGEGKYTQYLENFKNNDIRVNLISKISDEWWENKLHITSLGHILTLKEAASKYV